MGKRIIFIPAGRAIDVRIRILEFVVRRILAIVYIVLWLGGQDVYGSIAQ